MTRIISICNIYKFYIKQLWKISKIEKLLERMWKFKFMEKEKKIHCWKEWGSIYIRDWQIFSAKSQEVNIGGLGDLTVFSSTQCCHCSTKTVYRRLYNEWIWYVPKHCIYQKPGLSLLTLYRLKKDYELINTGC